MNSTYERMKERYLAGEIPWDDELPPPEVQELADRLQAGRALDLGCGYGRTAIYLARMGWQVDGVDFIQEAIEGARLRAQDAGVTSVHFHLGSVTELTFLAGPYDFAVDIGCGHSLDEAGLIVYLNGLARLLRPGATFLWFMRLREPLQQGEEGAPTGLSLALVQRVSVGVFQVERKAIGHTEMSDGFAWSSAWLCLKRV